MDPSYAPESVLSTQPPRARAIVEFIEGDLSKPPVVFPQAGTEELDEALRREIRRRWDRQPA